MPTRSGKLLTIIASCFFLLTSAASLYARQQPPEVQVSVEKLADNLYLIRDSGGMGNTTVLTGEEGVFMIDTKVRDSVDKLLAKIAELSPAPIRFALDTHWHFDHVGGNEKVARTGAVIIAHENVRKQMARPHDMKILNVKVPASPVAARPMLTYDRQMVLHLNGEQIKVFHPGPGHTDGDSVVYFKKANVIHMGDLYFEGLYPYIGIYSGGSINSMIAVIGRILPMIDAKTIVVPGHGPASDKARLAQYVAMLTAVRDSVSRLIQRGDTIEQAVTEKPTRAFDEKWGKGFLSPDQFTRLVYMDLSPALP